MPLRTAHLAGCRLRCAHHAQAGAQGHALALAPKRARSVEETAVAASLGAPSRRDHYGRGEGRMLAKHEVSLVEGAVEARSRLVEARAQCAVEARSRRAIRTQRWCVRVSRIPNTLSLKKDLKKAVAVSHQRARVYSCR